MILDLLLPGSAMAAVLVAIYRNDRRRVMAQRAAFFDSLRPLLPDGRLDLQRDGFPRLRAIYRGHEVRLAATAEGLAARKLPSLWLEVTVLTPIPHRGTLDYLLRPGQSEIFSPSHRLEHRLGVPPGWPSQPAMLRTDLPGDEPPLAVVGRHLRLCEDPRFKEILITPRGVRFVYQADEAARSHYLLLRQAHFEGPPLSPSLVSALLDGAIALAEDLQPPAAEMEGNQLADREDRTISSAHAAP